MHTLWHEISVRVRADKSILETKDYGENYLDKTIYLNDSQQEVVELEETKAPEVVKQVKQEVKPLKPILKASEKFDAVKSLKVGQNELAKSKQAEKEDTNERSMAEKMNRLSVSDNQSVSSESTTFSLGDISKRIILKKFNFLFYYINLKFKVKDTPKASLEDKVSQPIPLKEEKNVTCVCNIRNVDLVLTFF